MDSNKEAEWLYFLRCVCLSSVPYLLRMILMALKTAISATPISPKTASHIVAMPATPMMMKNNFTPSANIMFCHTMVRVLFAILITVATADGESVISTASAVSIAASEPKAPMAIPTSARASTGASFIPSPTKATLPPLTAAISS